MDATIALLLSVHINELFQLWFDEAVSEIVNVQMGAHSSFQGLAALLTVRCEQWVLRQGPLDIKKCGAVHVLKLRQIRNIF